MKRGREKGDQLRVTVAHTGACEGDYLEGVEYASGENTSVGVLLHVVRGNVLANTACIDRVPREELVAAIAKLHKTGLDAARHFLEAVPKTPEGTDNALAIGRGPCCLENKGSHTASGNCECPPGALFVIVKPGRWWDYAGDSQDTLEAYIRDKTPVTWRDILRLFGHKTLMLRASLFAVVRGPRPTEPDESTLDCCPKSLCSKTYQMTESLSVTVPVSGPPLKSDWTTALDLLGPEYASMASLYTMLSRLSIGVLKSMLQKTVRAGAAATVLPDGTSVESDRLAGLLVCMISIHPGSFVPSIQSFCRGIVSGFKRAAIIVIEDAWIEDRDGQQILLGCALAAQRMPDYWPPKSIIQRAIRMMTDATCSPCVLAWHSSDVCEPVVEVSPHFSAFVDLVTELKSFPGDLKMLSTVARRVRKNTLGPMYRSERLETIPLYHGIDQHCCPAICHLMPEIPPHMSTFKVLFHYIFASVTGVNSRHTRRKSDAGFCQNVRTAQKTALELMLRKEAAVVTGEETPITVAIPYGTLAAGVGPVPIKIRVKKKMVNLYGFLPTIPGGDEIVMLRPSRAKKTDYLDWGDADDRAAAVAKMRKMILPVKSPLLPNASATWMDGEWYFNGRRWSAVVADGLSITTRLPADARAKIADLCAATEPSIVRRTLTILHQHYAPKLSLPTPSISGQSKGAVLSDYKTWQFLRAIGQIVPQALDPSTPPRFIVREPIVLQCVRQWIESAAARSIAQQTLWHGDGWPQIYRTCNGMLRPHQRQAVHEMLEQPGESVKTRFLVMGTGDGKSYAALVFTLHILLNTSVGSKAKYIIWITPPGRDAAMIDSLTEQLRRLNVPVCTDGIRCGAISIVRMDALRGMDLDVAAESFVLVDEVDRFYNETQRTACALDMVNRSLYSVLLTATPVPGNRSIANFIGWLRLIVDFPVSEHNYLVAASKIVAMRIDLGFESEYRDVELDTTPAARQAHARYLETHNWRELYLDLLNQTDAEYCRQAHALALEDRAAHPDGGCFVVCYDRRHEERLVALFNSMFSDMRAGNHTEMANPDVGAVFVIASHNRGYNSGVRLGIQMRQPYPGSAASRIQMEGRIRRLTQKRKKLVYVVFYMKHTLVHLLHSRQQKDDGVNYSLDALAQTFNSDCITFD